MNVFKVLFCQILLFGIALSLPVETKMKEKKSVPEVTTHIPVKVHVANSINNEKVQSSSNAQAEKASTIKRNVLRVLADKDEYSDDDFYEGRGAEDYENNQATRLSLENTRSENSLFDSGKYNVNGYRYYDDESRRKRTSTLDNIFNKADNNQKPEIHLSPEDLMVLAAYRQQHRLYNSFPYGRWTDINNSIEFPEETETDEIYNRPENFFDRYYDQRYQNWVNLPRGNKFKSHQSRTAAEHPELRMSLYKRAFL